MLRRLVAWIAALFILFEEWGWEPLQRALSRISAALGLDRIERWAAQLSPRHSLALVGLPMLLLLPVKLFGLALLAAGHALAGLGVILAAKVCGTTLVARLFAITRPSLLRLPTFARLYPRWLAWKRQCIDELNALPAWQALKLAIDRLRQPK